MVFSSARVLLPTALLLLSSSVFAQNAAAVVDYAKLPACVRQCTILTNAEKACIPPTQPVTSQNAYQACFCSSPALTLLYSNGAGVCNTACTQATDLQALSTYYIQLCTGGVVVTPGVQNQNPASPTNTGAGATGQPSSTSTNSPQVAAAPGNQTWIAGHWQWVLMIIILVIAMTLGLVLGFWLKRRIRRKRDLKNANVGSRAAPGFNNGNSRTYLPADDIANPDSTNPAEMAMAAGAARLPPPRPPRPESRSRAGTAGSHFSGQYPRTSLHNLGSTESYKTHDEKEVGGDYFPPGPAPMYTGTNDLPDRMYSPVASRRGSAYMGSRPSTGYMETDSVRSPVSEMYDYSNTSAPLVEDSVAAPGGITSPQRIREMRSREQVARNSPLHHTEALGPDGFPEVMPKHPARRLSKNRNAS